MKKFLLMLAIVLIASALGTGSALAAGEDLGGFFSSIGGATGDLISGEIYGNTSNPSENGEGVLPSWSPGPWVCDRNPGCDGPTNPGGSMGDFLAPVASDGTASPDFADGNDQDIDFSASHL